MTSITIQGDKELIAKINKMKNPLKLLDVAVKDTALKGFRDLVVNTPKKTGNTARAWIPPRKVSDSKYEVVSNLKTADKKYSVVRILNDGRGVVRPKSKKHLYIPLTNKGRSKPLGAPIGDGLEFGVDYVLAKQSAATKPTKFIEKSGEESAKDLVNFAMREVKKIHG